MRRPQIMVLVTVVVVVCAVCRYLYLVAVLVRAACFTLFVGLVLSIGHMPLCLVPCV